MRKKLYLNKGRLIPGGKEVWLVKKSIGYAESRNWMELSEADMLDHEDIEVIYRYDTLEKESIVRKEETKGGNING